MKKTILIILSIPILAGCVTNKTITGTVTNIKTDTVTINYIHKFQVYDTSGLYIGKEGVSFTKSVRRKKINSKKIN